MELNWISEWKAKQTIQERDEYNITKKSFFFLEIKNINENIEIYQWIQNVNKIKKWKRNEKFN